MFRLRDLHGNAAAKVKFMGKVFVSIAVRYVDTMEHPFSRLKALFSSDHEIFSCFFASTMKFVHSYVNSIPTAARRSFPPLACKLLLGGRSFARYLRA